METNNKRQDGDEESYREFERKMELFEDGPTTTDFERLVAAGIDLPNPDALADEDVRTKLWQVLAELAKLRTFLDQTDLLSDRELYAKLWHDVLREEVPAIDEIGFNNHVDLLSNGGDEETRLYLQYYADEKWRQDWVEQFQDYVLPECAELPYERDYLLPRPSYELGPDARDWLRANWSESAFASNRFGRKADALEFVNQLHAAGAQSVRIAGMMFLPNHDWTPYADELSVEMPTDARQRDDLFALMRDVGKPDEHDRLGPLTDTGQDRVRLWWD